METASLIKLHPSRIGQLKSLADHHETTVAEVIERFITAEILAGRIPDKLDGIEIEPRRKRVAVTIGGVALPAMGAHQAVAVSGEIRDLAIDNSRPGIAVTLDKAKCLIGRRGRGYTVIASLADGSEAKLSLTRHMLFDVARQLERAAIEATLAN